MKKGSILVILALQLALLAGAQSLPADDLPAIRLPSDAKGERNHVVAEGCDKQKPWGDCCDVAICNRKMPPGCTCTDKVESCSSACKDCKEVSSDPPRYVCRDLYDFNLEDYLKNGIPKCTKQKPWGDCCDMAICNKKMPPGCTCTDKVESCSSACKDCKEVSSDPPRYVCRDWYDFDLEDYLKNGIPECTKQKPWGDCCDDAICNKKMPPGCTCTDKVESCSSACKDCKEVSSDPPRYVCRDWYDFDLEDYLKNGIPKCTKQKPWGDCCDMAICNRRLPPGCRCGDEVESCSSACKNCEEVSSDPPRYVCRDLYDFDLEDWLENGIPKCT